jgi:hypothetical protein
MRSVPLVHVLMLMMTLMIFHSDDISFVALNETKAMNVPQLFEHYREHKAGRAVALHPTDPVLSCCSCAGACSFASLFADY